MPFIFSLGRIAPFFVLLLLLDTKDCYNLEFLIKFILRRIDPLFFDSHGNMETIAAHPNFILFFVLLE
jgi:hypothetical protein